MKPAKIIIHHSATKDSGTVSIGAIRNYHKNALGWSDIGYHFLIECLRGDIEIVMGRMPDIKGAHCKGYNDGSLGVCIVGNFDLREPSRTTWNTGVKLVKFLMKQYNIETNQIFGHHEYNQRKTCPGKYFNMDRFRLDCG